MQLSVSKVDGDYESYGRWCFAVFKIYMFLRNKRYAHSDSSEEYQYTILYFILIDLFGWLWKMVCATHPHREANSHPTGSVHTGVDFCKKLCGVSIIRSGESVENPLSACCKGIRIGRILMQRDRDNGKQLHSSYMKSF